MGDESERHGMTGRLAWRVIEIIARVLDPDEREAVLGDFAESGERCDRALWNICGLVIRREAALWATLRPWFILIALVVPLGLLISVLSRITSGATSVYLWMYANNSDWDLFKSAGFWYVLAGASVSFFIQCLTLSCSSWTIGFVIGAVSGKFRRGTAFAFFLLLLAGELSFAPRYLAFFWQLRDKLLHARVLPVQNDPISPIFFYRVVFPAIVQIVLVGAPAFYGIVAGARFRKLTPLFRSFVRIAAITTLAALLARAPGFALLFYPDPPLWLKGPIDLVQLAAYWPIAYLLMVGIRGRLSPRNVQA